MAHSNVKKHNNPNHLQAQSNGTVKTEKSEKRFTPLSDKFVSSETLHTVLEVDETPSSTTIDIPSTSSDPVSPTPALPSPSSVSSAPGLKKSPSSSNLSGKQLEPTVVGGGGQDGKLMQMNVGMRRNKSSYELLPYQHEEAERYLAGLAKAFTLAVAYASNVGGVGTSTGTTPNIVMKGYADNLWQSHGYGESPVNFATWMIIGFPVAVFNLVFLLGWMQFNFVGIRKTLMACVCWSGKRDTTADEAVKKLLRREREALGKMSFEEIMVAIIFTLMVLLWFFRSPGFIPGWGDLPVFKDGYIHETVVSCVMVVVLFIVSPKLPKFWANPSTEDKRPEGILKWKVIEDKFPWGIIFLFGGGFALAEACTISGLSKWMGDQLAVLGNLPPWLMLAIICLFTIILANVMSSSATCSLLCPIVASMAESMGKNPLYLMFPVAISSSVAFLLPISNGTNALAYSRRKFKVTDMIKNGTPLTLFGIFSVVLFTLTTGNSFFDWETYPWEYTPATATSYTTDVICNTVV